MNKLPSQYAEVGLDQLELDPDAARLTDELMDALLIESVRTWGIINPIAIHELEAGHFQIIDGRRRYLCARELQFTTVPCVMYRDLNEAEIEELRFVLQDIHRPWTDQERQSVVRKLRRIREEATTEQRFGTASQV